MTTEYENSDNEKRKEDYKELIKGRLAEAERGYVMGNGTGVPLEVVQKGILEKFGVTADLEARAWRIHVVNSGDIPLKIAKEMALNELLNSAYEANKEYEQPTFSFLELEFEESVKQEIQEHVKEYEQPTFLELEFEESVKQEILENEKSLKEFMAKHKNGTIIYW